MRLFLSEKACKTFNFVLSIKTLGYFLINCCYKLALIFIIKIILAKRWKMFVLYTLFYYKVSVHNRNIKILKYKGGNVILINYNLYNIIAFIITPFLKHKHIYNKIYMFPKQESKYHQYCTKIIELYPLCF